MGYWKVRWVVLSAIQLKFDSMVQDYMNTVCGFLGNDNCNDNDYGNGNGGKKLGDSTVYGATTTTTSARIPQVYWAFLLWIEILVQWCQDLWML